MKTQYTSAEAKTVLGFAKDEFDLVRLVDPNQRHVWVLKDSGAEKADEICSGLWGRCERCENCTSARALQNKGSAYKIEFLDEKTFLVISKFMEVNGMPLVMELVSDISSDLLMDSDKRSEVAHMIQNYNHLLISDPLTGVFNRRFLDEGFVPSIDCCQEQSTTVNLALMDIDSFKNINDTYGHQAGDQLIRDVAGFWKLHFHSRAKEKERLVIRYGGDELLVVACGVGFEKFKKMMNSYYEQMRRVCYYSEEIHFPFSISFGFSSSEELGEQWSWNDLFDRADKRMYADKKKEPDV